MGEGKRLTGLERAPRLRAGVTLVPRPAEAGGGVIVADREGRRHFRVGDVEGRLLQLLDGTRSLARVHARLAVEFPEAELSRETIAGFARQLEELGLLEGSTLPPRRRLTTSGLMNLQVPLGNPERFFRAVVERRTAVRSGFSSESSRFSILLTRRSSGSSARSLTAMSSSRPRTSPSVFSIDLPPGSSPRRCSASSPASASRAMTSFSCVLRERAMPRP